MNKLRIVHIVEAAEGGVARHLHDLLDGLYSAGHQSLVVYAPGREDRLFRELRRDMGSRGVAFVSLEMNRGLGARDVTGCFALRQLVQRAKDEFQIFHAHSSKAGALTRLAIPAPLRARIVYTPHAFFSLNPSLPLVARAAFGRIERWLSARCGAVIAVSAQEREHALELGIPASKVHLIPHGITPFRSGEYTRGRDLRKRLGVGEDEYLFCFVGRFVSQKAPEVALKAFINVAKARPKCRLLMAGDGPLESEIRKLAADAGLETHVLFPGRIEGRIAFLAADAAIQPSRYESFGYVFLEALAAGIPLIATPTGAAEELARNSVGCRLVSVDDTRQLEAAMLDVSENHATTGVPEPPRLPRAFSLEAMTASTIEVYRSLMNFAGGLHLGHNR